MSAPIRVLHILQRMEAGGTQAFLMNIYRNIDKTQVQFDFLVEYPEKQFYDDEIISMGGRIFYSDVRKSKNIFKFKTQLKNIIQKNNYKIVHVHTYSIGCFVLRAAKKYNVNTRIAHAHSNSMTKKNRTIKKLLKVLYPIWATDYLACSEEAAEFQFHGKPYLIIKNPIDLHKFIFNKRARLKTRNGIGIKDELLVGHVGRFKPEKNHSFLFKVFLEIKQVEKNAKLLLIGNGENQETIHKMIKENALEESVIVMNNIRQIDKMYQAMDLFIFPSLYEGLGMTTIEAQASGLPVVCSDRLPDEVRVTNNIIKLSLNDAPQEWAKTALKLFSTTNRGTNTDERLKEYDARETAYKMQQYYIKRTLS